MVNLSVTDGRAFAASLADCRKWKLRRAKTGRERSGRDYLIENSFELDPRSMKITVN